MRPGSAPPDGLHKRTSCARKKFNTVWGRNPRKKRRCAGSICRSCCCSVLAAWFWLHSALRRFSIIRPRSASRGESPSAFPGMPPGRPLSGKSGSGQAIPMVLLIRPLPTARFFSCFRSSSLSASGSASRRNCAPTPICTARLGGRKKKKSARWAILKARASMWAAGSKNTLVFRPYSALFGESRKRCNTTSGTTARNISWSLRQPAPARGWA